MLISSRWSRTSFCLARSCCLWISSCCAKEFRIPSKSGGTAPEGPPPPPPPTLPPPPPRAPRLPSSLGYSTVMRLPSNSRLSSNACMNTVSCSQTFTSTISRYFAVHSFLSLSPSATHDAAHFDTQACVCRCVCAGAHGCGKSRSNETFLALTVSSKLAHEVKQNRLPGVWLILTHVFSNPCSCQRVCVHSSTYIRPLCAPVHRKRPLAPHLVYHVLFRYCVFLAHRLLDKLANA